MENIIDNTTVGNTTVEQTLVQEDLICNPWEVSAEKAIDYMRLVNEFGTQLLDKDLIERFEAVTGVEAHIWIKRGIFFSHRDLDKVLDDYEQGKPIYLYTGRGPSSEAMHLGHMLPFQFTKYLQDAFNAVVIIQMSDDEKYYFKDGQIEYFNNLTYKNVVDIIACGFNPDKTFIFSNYEMGGEFYFLEAQLNKHTTLNQTMKTYGFNGKANMGMISWPIKQMLPCFPQIFPHIFGELKEPPTVLVPCAIDQEVYFRHLRDIAPKLGLKKPTLILCEFLPDPNGLNGKMSSTSGQGEAIFTTDDPKTIMKKANKVFSGGRTTLEEHRQFGGDINTDISYQYLRFFEENIDTLNEIGEKFTSGELSNGEIKKIMGDKIIKVLMAHQERRDAVTQEVIDNFFAKKPLVLN